MRSTHHRQADGISINIALSFLLTQTPQTRWAPCSSTSSKSHAFANADRAPIIRGTYINQPILLISWYIFLFVEFMISPVFFYFIPALFAESYRCALENFPSGLFTSISSRRDSDQTFLGQLSNFGRSLGPQNAIIEEERLRVASFGLIARNLFKDIVVRPVQGFSQFWFTAKEIIDG